MPSNRFRKIQKYRCRVFGGKYDRLYSTVWYGILCNAKKTVQIESTESTNNAIRHVGQTSKFNFWDIGVMKMQFSFWIILSKDCINIGSVKIFPKKKYFLIFPSFWELKSFENMIQKKICFFMTPMSQKVNFKVWPTC